MLLRASSRCFTDVGLPVDAQRLIKYCLSHLHLTNAENASIMCMAHLYTLVTFSKMSALTWVLFVC